MSFTIKYPGKHDVMLGRGGESNCHSGNIAFRQLAQTHKGQFRLGSRNEKRKIVDEVVSEWRHQDPAGRFVAKKKLSNGEVVWYDVGDDVAKKRTAKSLAEWSPQTPQSATPKRQRSNEIMPSQRPEELKRSRSADVRGDDDSSVDFSSSLTQYAVLFSPPSMSSSTSLSVALPSVLPGFPQMSLQLPPGLQPDRSTLMSGSIQHQTPVANLRPQDDLVMTGILSNMNQLCNVSSNMMVQPIDRIRMNIPTAAELSNVFSDDEKSSNSGSSRESNGSSQNKGMFSDGIPPASWYQRLSKGGRQHDTATDRST